MKVLPSLKSEVTFARNIVKAGLDAAGSARQPAPGQETAASLTRVSQSALAPAAIGAAVGVLSVVLGRRGRLGTTQWSRDWRMLVGFGCGFVGGVAWGTRDVDQTLRK